MPGCAALKIQKINSLLSPNNNKQIKCHYVTQILHIWDISHSNLPTQFQMM